MYLRYFILVICGIWIVLFAIQLLELKIIRCVICYKKAMPKQDKANATNGISR